MSSPAPRRPAYWWLVAVAVIVVAGGVALGVRLILEVSSTCPRTPGHADRHTPVPEPLNFGKPPLSFVLCPAEHTHLGLGIAVIAVAVVVGSAAGITAVRRRPLRPCR